MLTYNMALRSPNLSDYWATIGLESFMVLSSNPLFTNHVIACNEQALAQKEYQIEVEVSLSWCNVLNGA